MAPGNCQPRSHSLVRLAGSQMDGNSESYLPPAMVYRLPRHGARAATPPTPTAATILRIRTGSVGPAAGRAPILATRTTTLRLSASAFRLPQTGRFGTPIVIGGHRA